MLTVSGKSIFDFSSKDSIYPAEMMLPFNVVVTQIVISSLTIGKSKINKLDS